jgi:hypothetical protein
MKRINATTSLLGSAAVGALLLAGLPAKAEEIQTIRAEIQALQKRLSQLESRRVPAPAAAVESGAKPRSWKLPGTNTSMQIGGFAKLDLIYDINAFAGDFLAAGALPVSGSAAGNRQGNFRIHARETRFWIRTWTPTDWGELATHVEGDFYGTGGNQLVVNSNSLQIRHAYGRLGPVLAGQTWSTFMLLKTVPESLNFNGPVGEVFVRQGMVRYSQSFGGGTMLDLAVENPETGLIVAPGGLAAATGIGPSNDHIPDFTVRLSHRWSQGYIGLAALFRQLNVDDGGTTGLSVTAFSWGLNFGGKFFFNNKRNSIGFAVVGGEGLGRYIIGGPRTAVLNGVNSVTASLDPVTTVGGYVWFKHRWNDVLRSTFTYARLYADVTGANSTGAGGKIGLGAIVRDFWTAHANLIWSPAPRVDIGAQYTYAFNGVINSANGTTHRLQASFKYRF